jgi:hypothetical protein
MSQHLFGDIDDFVVGGANAGVTSICGCVDRLDAMVNRLGESGKAVVAVVKTVSFFVNNIDAVVTRISVAVTGVDVRVPFDQALGQVLFFELPLTKLDSRLA